MGTIVFFSAPYRVFFAGGLAQLLFALVFWGIELAGRQTGAMWSWPAPATWLHGGMMLYGFFPWFILGFLMTALPKWMDHPPLARRDYLTPFGLLASAAVAYDLGLFVPSLLAFGAYVAALALLWAVAVLWRVSICGQGSRAHAWLSLLALTCGAIGWAGHGLALARLDAGWQVFAVRVGVWCFLLPLFFIVLHRMLPFFSVAALPGVPLWRSSGVLFAMLLCFLGHAALSALALPVWPADLVAAGLAWYCLVRWGFVQALRLPMLAMLHGGWLWACLGLSLAALQSFWAAQGVFWGGLAPLHVLGLGCFASLLLGMGTRVSRGHSGRAIADDYWGWRCFLILQAAVLLRLAGEFEPFAGGANLLALLLALIACSIWGVVHGPMYFQPRSDGIQE